MLASLRHLLRFIDLDATFDRYGFTKKVRPPFNTSLRIYRRFAQDTLFRFKILTALLYSTGTLVGA